MSTQPEYVVVCSSWSSSIAKVCRRDGNRYIYYAEMGAEDAVELVKKLNAEATP